MKTSDLALYSQLFRGKARINDKAIIESLLESSPLNSYELTRQVLSKKTGSDATYNAIMSYYSTILRRVRSLEKTGFLEKCGTVQNIMGTTINNYRLGFRGALSTLIMTFDMDENEEYSFFFTSNDWSQNLLHQLSNNSSLNLNEYQMMNVIREVILDGLINIDVIEYNTLLNILPILLNVYLNTDTNRTIDQE